MSFESDSEKKTPMNTTQIHRNSTGWKAPPPAGAHLRQPPPNARSADRVKGTLPAKNTAPKNHHGSWRSAMGVKYRARCSRTKKNSRKSGSRRAASQCQGTVMTRNSGRPQATLSLRHGPKSREYALYSSSTATGKAAATRPLVSTPKAVAAQASIIHALGRVEVCASRKAARLRVM